MKKNSFAVVVCTQCNSTNLNYEAFGFIELPRSQLMCTGQLLFSSDRRCLPHCMYSDATL
jgi:hypothetical protein